MSGRALWDLVITDGEDVTKNTTAASHCTYFRDGDRGSGREEFVIFVAYRRHTTHLPGWLCTHPRAPLSPHDRRDGTEARSPRMGDRVFVVVSRCGRGVAFSVVITDGLVWYMAMVGWLEL